MQDLTPGPKLAYERPFQMWSYTVGHSRLLLRSNKSPIEASRVDVLFKDVDELKLPTAFDRLEIREAAPDDLIRLGVDAGADNTVFVVSTGRQDGYVVAAVVAVAEDDKEYDEPSQLLL